MAGHKNFSILQAELEERRKLNQGCMGSGCCGCGRCDSELGIGSATEHPEPKLARPESKSPYYELCVYNNDDEPCPEFVIRGAEGVVVADLPRFVVYGGTEEEPHGMLSIISVLVCSGCVEKRGVPRKLVDNRPIR
ncbi:MAG: hypothetical protein Q7R73_05070 [bacterium]|nr:hypothetical protein [bacterium]